MGRQRKHRNLSDLTARELEVLALVREGLTNPQIAKRLNISLETAKHHVSEILSKLGVATREEAALAFGERQRWWATWPLWARIAGSATATATVVGVTVLAWATIRTNEPIEESDFTVEPPIASAAVGTQGFDLTIYGSVVAIEGNVLTVQRVGSLSAEVAIEITPDTAITRDGQQASAADARLGEFVFAFLRKSRAIPVAYHAVILRLGEPSPAGWTIVPPENRTDIQMIDVTEAKLFLPSPADAADCEIGDLDPVKAEEVIRKWLTDHRAELSRTRIWDQTQVMVVCAYPSNDFGEKLALFIGIPYSGYSYIAPQSCQIEAEDLPPDAPVPDVCTPPAGIEPPLEVDSHTIVVKAEEVLR